MQKKRSGIFFFPTSNPVAAHAANRFSSSQHLSNFLKLKDVTLIIFYLTNTVITYRLFLKNFKYLFFNTYYYPISYYLD